jgi:hypothetical protein
MTKNLIASTAVAGTLTALAGTTVLVAAPAHADVDRRGTCAGATYELGIDRERGGYDVDADVEGARPSSEWKVVIRHNGTVATARTLTADREGELDVDTWRRNTSGSDVFTLIVTPVGRSACTVTARVR